MSFCYARKQKLTKFAIFAFFCYICLIIFSICKIEEPNKDIIITITKRPSYIAMKYNSMFSLETDFLDNENIFDISDIQEKTDFESSVSDSDNNKYKIFCNLWKPKADNLRLFCTLKENIPSNIDSLKMEEISSFKYKDYNRLQYTNKTKYYHSSIHF